jgi:hypothetical protein
MMYLLSNVLKFSKDINHKYLKHYLIHKELKYSLLVLIVLLKFGISNLVKLYKYYKDIKIRYFLVNLIIKVILLLQGRKIILVRYGGMFFLLMKMEIRLELGNQLRRCRIKIIWGTNKGNKRNRIKIIDDGDSETIFSINYY